MGVQREVGVKSGCKQGCCAGARPGEVLAAHGAGSGEHKDNQNRRCHAPIVGFAAVRPL